jgi:hypothetical protein
MRRLEHAPDPVKMLDAALQEAAAGRGGRRSKRGGVSGVLRFWGLKFGRPDCS